MKSTILMFIIIAAFAVQLSTNDYVIVTCILYSYVLVNVVWDFVKSIKNL
jgi:uncharacterized membrane protein YqjE